MESFSTDPLLSSEHIRALSARVLAFDQALATGPAALDPFRGQTTIGKRWRDEVLVNRDFEPIRGPLLGHLDYLLERRLSLPVSLEESAQLTQVCLPADAPFANEGTISERRLQALTITADPERRDEARLAWRFLARAGAGLSAVRVLRYERWIEIEQRLGARLTPLVTFEDPAHGVGELARSLLESTSGAAAALLGADWAGLMAGATGHLAGEGWPARLGTDSLLELLGGRWLIEDTGLGRVHTPPRLCPASFARAAVHLGREVFRACVPGSLPFVLARSPAEMGGRAWGRLLALWLLSPACARRKLGLGPQDRARHERGAARLLLADARLLAARALLAGAGRTSRSRLDQTWDDLARALGFDFDQESSGPPLGLFSAPPAAEVDLVAFLWALLKEEELVHAFDEDFLDNPRAREAILADLHGTESPLPPLPTLVEAISGLATRVSLSA